MRTNNMWVRDLNEYRNKKFKQKYGMPESATQEDILALEEELYWQSDEAQEYLKEYYSNYPYEEEEFEDWLRMTDEGIKYQQGVFENENK